ncbi:MAG: hypothetical protein RIC16_14970 [Rhodospirillales bacterium]
MTTETEAPGTEPPAHEETPDAPSRPDGVPDKFWDADSGTIRTEALMKSYGELERRLGVPTAAVPETAEDYEISPPEGFEELLASDPDINARLHEAGFSQAQAALVYELAAERLVPLVENLAGDLQVRGAHAELARHFGGDDAWRTARPQIEAWGRANLDGDTFRALACSADGVIAMHRLMQSGEPAVMRDSHTGGAPLGETELQQMMHDPRYWRDEDPAYVARVRRGFEALYPD